MKTGRLPNGTAQAWIEAHIEHQGNDCLIWPFSCATPGYGQFMPRGSGRIVMAHRYICEAAHGPAPSDTHQAAHSCGNRRCVNPTHLSWKTRAENQKERDLHGTQNTWGLRGKLQPHQADQIRRLKGVETSIETAAKYGVTESNVRLIQDGVTWRAERKIRRTFTDDQVRFIRKIGYSMSEQEVADLLGLKSCGAIGNIRRGKYYRHVR